MSRKNLMNLVALVAMGAVGCLDDMSTPEQKEEPQASITLALDEELSGANCTYLIEQDEGPPTQMVVDIIPDMAIRYWPRTIVFDDTSISDVDRCKTYLTFMTPRVTAFSKVVLNLRYLTIASDSELNTRIVRFNSFEDRIGPYFRVDGLDEGGAYDLPPTNYQDTTEVQLDLTEQLKALGAVPDTLQLELSLESQGSYNVQWATVEISP